MVADIIWTMFLFALLSRSYWWSGCVLTHRGHRAPCPTLIFCEIVRLHQKTTGPSCEGRAGSWPSGCFSVSASLLLWGLLVTVGWCTWGAECAVDFI